jgi:hypothetical protein
MVLIHLLFYLPFSVNAQFVMKHQMQKCFLSPCPVDIDFVPRVGKGKFLFITPKNVICQLQPYSMNNLMKSCEGY